MESPAIRRRSPLPSYNLRDLLKFHDDDIEITSPRPSITLATALAAEKTAAAAAARGGARTLLDVIREEDESRGGGGSSRWWDLADRGPIRPVAAASTSDRTGEGAVVRVSLMTLMEMREREEEEERGAAVMAVAEVDDDVAVEEESRHVCCVCMVRKKGAAFIPCGHTFCRVCSRELLMGTGSCPLCKGTILEVLDIF